jgi:dTDP-glucose pyrophosphorylase
MNNSNQIEERSISPNESILNALKKMDLINKKLLLVIDQDRFIGLLSIGDIQRAIIANIDFLHSVKAILRSDIKVANISEKRSKIKKDMLEFRIECMPILDDDNNLVEVLFWEDIFGNEYKRKIEKLTLPVVIMAGGKGTRLKPITNIIPKALIPIGEKTIIEDIMDKFTGVGCRNFYISVNYKAEMIKHYFATLKVNNYNIEYFQEDKPLGTAGSMYLIKDKINSTFFVSNCDIIIDQDYSEIYNYHKENQNDITIVAALKHYKIPYGIIKSGKNGHLIDMDEKPELIFKINSGLYILEPNVLNFIPAHEHLHITELINILKQKNGKIGVFPVSEKSWRDIGEWASYKELI